MTQATLVESPFHNSNLFSAYYLSERLRDRAEWDCDEEAGKALDELTDLYEHEKDLLPGYKEDALIDSWIDEVLDILGYGTNVETTLPEGDGYVDVLLFEDTQTRRDAAGVYLDTKDTTDLFEGGLSLLEAKQWDADFTKRFSENRPYYNASQQIRRYLDKTPSNIEWGILTNGRKWRLYGTKDHEAQIYYEVDLPELIEDGRLNRFKYFYLFFRPDAFRSVSGSTFLDSVWSESETATQELGDDLQDNVFRALRVLGHGIVETNDLDIDPNDDEKLSELKEQSLVLLYRLMFVLYAESRQLIDPEGKQAQKEYEQNFSLNQHRLDIHDTIGEVDTGFEDEYSTFSTSIWNDLQDIFRLVDQGKESLGIPPYNGGLFDHEEHAYLTEHKVSDRHLAEVIYRLSTTENDEGRYVLADYGDLDTRHLGSVYEGLLEHQFRIAPEDYAAVAEDGGQVWKPATEADTNAVETVDEGSLYVTNDEGERKATGAYYTPDYVVNYIVEETVGPLVDDIRDDLVEQGFETGTQEYLGAFLRRVTQLKILDPAMGSGHFLTGATGYLAEQVMKEVREVEVEMGVAFNEQHVRREIAKECIYGVDINGMAVELAKLSMWLETLAADRPLAFLDHHLKTGNSLVGSDITEVLSEDNEEADGQLTLSQSFARARQQTLEHVMELMSDLLAIDNERLEDIKSMEELYDEIRDDPLYQRLFEVANVHTAEQFGVDVPDGVYKQMAGAIDDADAWAEIRGEDWFASAQALTSEQSVFHWELEFPEAFFGNDGSKLEEAGFDAVIGNPPWMDFQRIGADLRDYQRNHFTAAKGKYDLYVVFTERALGLLNSEGEFGFIIQNRFLSSDYGSGLKSVLVDQTHVKELLDFEDAGVFAGTTTYPLILLTSSKYRESFGYVHGYDLSVNDVIEIIDKNVERAEIGHDRLDPSKTWIFPTAKQKKALESIRQGSSVTLGDATDEISTGIKTNLKEAYVFEGDKSEIPVEDSLLRPVLDGGDIRRYSSTNVDKYMIYPYETGPNNKLTPINLSDYPNAESHFMEYEDELRERLFFEKTVMEMGKEWFEFPYTSESLLSEKLLFPDISPEPRATYDSEGHVLILNTGYGAVLSDDSGLTVDYLSGLFNSAVVRFAFKTISPKLSGGYYRFQKQYVKQLPLVQITETQGVDHSEEAIDKLDQNIGLSELISSVHGLGEPTETSRNAVSKLAERMIELSEKYSNLNLSVLDHLGSYSDGQTLTDIGLTQPSKGSVDSILQETTTEKPNLRVGTVSVDRESETTIEILLSARYKPDNEDAYETDQWGYTETDLEPALRITDLSEEEADLIEAFVPVAVDEAGGFADFRETATKTNSLVDRLRKLTLPALSDVEAGLESYRQTKERAEELEEKIERTDELIDEIVYELYGLTDEEIEIIEEAVNG